MQITIRQTIQDALYILGVDSDSLPPSETAYLRALRSLQSYLSTLSSENLDIFLNAPYRSLDDVLPVREEAYIFIYSNLAIKIAPLYAVGPADPGYQTAQQTARDSERDIRALYSEIPSSVFPGNLPMGAGNMYENDGYNTTFYPNLDPKMYHDDDDCCDTGSGIFSGDNYGQ
jgi:hypothetical protein